jgi:hypothetical protein
VWQIRRAQDPVRKGQRRQDSKSWISLPGAKAPKCDIGLRFPYRYQTAALRSCRCGGGVASGLDDLAFRHIFLAGPCTCGATGQRSGG